MLGVCKPVLSPAIIKVDLSECNEHPLVLACQSRTRFANRIRGPSWGVLKVMLPMAQISLPTIQTDFPSAGVTEHSRLVLFFPVISLPALQQNLRAAGASSDSSSPSILCRAIDQGSSIHIEHGGRVLDNVGVSPHRSNLALEGGSVECWQCITNRDIRYAPGAS